MKKKKKMKPCHLKLPMCEDCINQWEVQMGLFSISHDFEPVCGDVVSGSGQEKKIKRSGGGEEIAKKSSFFGLCFTNFTNQQNGISNP